MSERPAPEASLPAIASIRRSRGTLADQRPLFEERQPWSETLLDIGNHEGGERQKQKRGHWRRCCLVKRCRLRSHQTLELAGRRNSLVSSKDNYFIDTSWSSSIKLILFFGSHFPFSHSHFLTFFPLLPWHCWSTVDPAVLHLSTF